MSRIELTNVTKRWGQFYAVDNLSMVIEDNRVRHCSARPAAANDHAAHDRGSETPTSGRITIDGVPVFDWQGAINVSANKRKVGFLFQNYALWPNMTVYQNISFGLTNIKGGNGRDRLRCPRGAAIEILQKSRRTSSARSTKCVDKKEEAEYG